MSFVRQCLQQLTRQLNGSLPRKVRYVNTDIVDKYQRLQDATTDTFAHRGFNSRDCEEAQKRSLKFEKFPYLGKLMRLLALSVCVGASCKKIGDVPKAVMPVVAAAFSSKTPPTPQDKKKDRSKEPCRTPSEIQAIRAESKKECSTLGEYEHRLKSYSSPEQVFRYYASICLISDRDTEIVMTPLDFLRSICPAKKQPKNIGLDCFRRVDRDKLHQLEITLMPTSIFYILGYNSLVTYPNYQFLMTVLTTSPRHFEIAFQMMDNDEDGLLNQNEFQNVIALARQSASFAAIGQNLNNKSISKELLRYFFGPDLKGFITIHDFLKFQNDFKEELLTLEFYTKPNVRGCISETDFAELLIAYTGYSYKERQEKLNRVQKRFRHNSRGVSRKDYVDFWNLLNNLNDIEMALSFYSLAGTPIDKSTLHHIVKTVAKVQLSDQAIEIAFTVFDDNDEEKVCKREFVDAMKKHLYRGMGPKPACDFNELLIALKKCALERRTHDF